MMFKTRIRCSNAISPGSENNGNNTFSAWPQIPVAITTWDSSINEDVFIVQFCIEEKERDTLIYFFSQYVVCNIEFFKDFFN